MTIDADPFPKPPHILDDMPAWLDLSTFRAYELERLTPEMVAAADFVEPKDKALLFLRVSAIAQRRQWEATHPHREPFPGVFLAPIEQST